MLKNHIFSLVQHIISTFNNVDIIFYCRKEWKELMNRIYCGINEPYIFVCEYRYIGKI